MRKLFISYVAILLFTFCTNNKDSGPLNSFIFPDIIDTLKTASYYASPQIMTVAVNEVRTIQKIGEKANLLEDAFTKVNFINDNDEKDTANKSIVLNTGLSIYVDTTREISVDMEPWDSPPYVPYETFGRKRIKDKIQYMIDSVTEMAQYQAKQEYKTLIKGFPVYIVNHSKQAVRVEIEGGRLAIIQEALDTSGKWKPVEAWLRSHCGNAYNGLALRPGYYLMTQLYKYKGSFETLLRLKMLNGKEIYYSQPFHGSINVTQMDASLVERRTLTPENFLNK